MHLVLTHEQADFDGVAAACAVWLLDRRATPVLPRRVNRNVRAFLTLYGEQLPFARVEDLAGDPIDQVTLVDTQSLPSLKGAASETRIHVIDHHPADPKLSVEWSAHVQEIGATTTILVGDLRRAGVELGLVQATLLLLGIYEDTGSLTYASTTPDDLMAAAWLLESGANLSIVAEFLDPPLSAEQRALYEQLLECAETHTFHGLAVVVAGAKTDGRIDEISSIAHKLRDVFDPAGLFVLVEMEGHVQLVARSGSDDLDVGSVARKFDGGGHPRAAAAIVRDRSLESVRQALLDMLPGVIEPPTTVSEIMSRGPQLLGPDATVAEAAQRMQRSGHEGYPIVDGDEVLGLLTRRAVDRAMAHGLGSRSVSSVMKVGDLVVHPEDSVQVLQRQMILNDWGQVPVVDRETGAIVGIVTRTDLLRTIGKPVEDFTERNLADRLDRALPAPRLQLLKAIAGEAEASDDALYVVGGFVRDLLLGEPSVDFDLVVEGDAIQLAFRLAERYGGHISSHRRFGTAKWQLDRGAERLHKAIGGQEEGVEGLPAAVDFVSARSEFYLHPTALPTVERGSIKLDLHRRDFTINTLALRLDGRYYGRLLDHWGGGQDLRDGLIRVLHSLSFVDDPTRMLRAVRLEQRLGFKIEDRTLELLHDAVGLLDRVSGDRIRSELSLVLKEDSIIATMGRFAELGLLRAIHPELPWDPWLQSRWQQAQSFQPLEMWDLQQDIDRDILFFGLWMFRKEPETIESICRRLRIPSADRDVLLGGARLRRMQDELGSDSSPSSYTEVMDAVPEASLAVAWIGMADDETGQVAIDRYLREWRWLQPTTDGHTLQQLGLPAGPVYQRILSRLRAAWLNGEVESVDQERGLLEKLVADEEANG